MTPGLLAVPCPYCGSQPGEPCVTNLDTERPYRDRQDRMQVHMDRVREFVRAAS